MKLNDKLFSTIRSATRNVAGKSAKGATSAIDVNSVIQDALKVLKPHHQAAAQPAAAPAMRDINPPPQGRAEQPAQPQPQAHAERPAAAPAASPASQVAEAMQNLMPDLMAKLNLPGQNGGASFSMPNFDLSKFDMPSFDLPGMQGGRGAAEPMAGDVIEGSYTNDYGTRTFKLYVPSTYKGEAAPLVVMLHGCTQDPDDFATGTGMNHLAEEMGCLVAYPAQSQQANMQRCWNWFNAADQQRDQGEPSLIAGITRTVMHNYKVDEAQVYVAGLSAGGAMAAIMGTLYPDLYAAVGVHSGLPFASAKDLPSAMAAMQGNFGRPIPAGQAIPIIVFHGDRDTTVHPSNGHEVIRQGAHPQAQTRTEPGEVPNGYTYTRVVHHHGDGTPHAEHWTIHGAGHAWMGGNSRGSYTDGRGPDASREMMRFFQPKRQ
jgi:poly(hydroxyalkanoate) depolymerase family esterase